MPVGSGVNAQSPEASCRRRTLLLCLFLVLAPLAVFWQVRNHDFVSYDDWQYITENTEIQQGLSLKSIGWAFTTVHGSNWHPLTWISHMLDVRLFGMHPRGHHLVNLIFHLANTVLVFLVFKKLAGEIWKPFVIAILFAIHPLHVESVAWVSERKDVLSAFFWLLTIWAYLGYLQRRTSARYLLVALSFTLGLLSKPTLVTLPFVLLLLDFWPLSRLELQLPGSGGPSRQWSAIAHLIREKAPLFLLAVMASAATLYAPWFRGTLTTPETTPFALRFASAVVSYAAYIEKTIFPSKLSFLYLYPKTIPSWKLVVAGLLLAAISVLAARCVRELPYLATGWLWYAGTMLPMIGFVQVGVQSMADRYTYLPHIGLFIIAAWGLPAMVATWRHGKALLAISAAGGLVLYSAAAWRQTGYWKNSAALYAHAIEVSDENYLAQFGLATVLNNQGRIEEALPYYLRALNLYPGYSQARHELARAYYSLGSARAENGRLEEAVDYLSKALQINPEFEEAHIKLEEALSEQRSIDGPTDSPRPHPGSRGPGPGRD